MTYVRRHAAFFLEDAAFEHVTFLTERSLSFCFFNVPRSKNSNSF